MSDGEKITQEEMVAMFGEEMPIEAVELLRRAPGDWTIGQVRDELRRIAEGRAASSMSETIPEDIREKADKLAGDIDMQFSVYDDGASLDYGEASRIIAQALLSERKDTLERAAKIAESHDRDDRSNWGRVIAKAIRGEAG